MRIYIACGLTHVPREIFEAYVGFLHGLAAGLRRLPEVFSVKYALLDSDPQLSIKHSRRVATRYDKLTNSFLGFVQLATIKIWIQFVHTT